MSPARTKPPAVRAVGGHHTSTLKTRFASIHHGSQYAYLINTEYHYNPNGGTGLADWAYMYETYGDDICQHSGEWHVGREFIVDFCASLAEYLVNLPAERLNDEASHMQSRWPEPVSRRELEFAFGVRFNPDKQNRYYNRGERKISPSASKRFDKRWHEIPAWADGGCLAMLGILREDRYNNGLLETYSIVRDCCEYRRERDEWSPQPVTALELEKVDPNGDLDSRFGVVSAILKSVRLQQFARRAVNGYRENLLLRAQQASKRQQQNEENSAA
jgi:hypothetical protein